MEESAFFLFNKQNVKIQEHVYTYSIHELSKDYKQLISNQHAYFFLNAYILPFKCSPFVLKKAHILRIV